MSRLSSFMLINRLCETGVVPSVARSGGCLDLEIQGQVDLRSLDQRQYLMDHGQN